MLTTLRRIAQLEHTIRFDGVTVETVTPTTMLAVECAQFEALRENWPEASEMIRAVAVSRTEENRMRVGPGGA